MHSTYWTTGNNEKKLIFFLIFFYFSSAFPILFDDKAKCCSNESHIWTYSMEESFFPFAKESKHIT